MQQDALAAGAAAVGGCCGTTPEHIRRLAQAVRACRRLRPAATAARAFAARAAV